MMSVLLRGGLGNAMFQIAAIEYLGKTFGQEVCYTNVDEWLNGLTGNYWLPHAEKYLEIFPNIDLYKNHNKRFVVKRRINIPFRYVNILPESGDLYIGYFQGEQNFPDSIFIKWLFEPSGEIKEHLVRYDELFSEKTCSVNIRRGNYFNFQQFHPVMDKMYFLQAIDFMKSHGVEKFLITSNDMRWCRNNFIGEEYVFIEEIDYLEMFLMARCDYHIISNSSFGWWQAWLGETKDKTLIVAPRKWFGEAMPEDHGADIVPTRWFKL